MTSRPYFASLQYTVHYINGTLYLVQFGKVLQIEVGGGAFTRVVEVSESVGKYVLEPSAVSVGHRDWAVAVIPYRSAHVKSGWLCPLEGWLRDRGIGEAEGGID